MIGIYKITSPTNRIYIGQSINIKKRFSDYKGLHCKKQSALYNSFLKHGIENHKFEIIEECDVKLLNELERYWQDYYEVLRYGLNCRLTTSKCKSGSLSEETILKMKISSTGKKFSQESRLKMSESQKRQSKETRLKRSIAGKGKKLTLLHKKNISESLKGKKKTKYTKNEFSTKIVLDLVNGIFYSVIELSNIYNKNPSYFYRRLLGLQINNTNYICV